MVNNLSHLDCPAEPVQGYFVDYRAAADTASVFRHSFCGPHDVGGAWCPNCRKPLLRFLGLDTEDNRLDLQACPSADLPLLFCWTCSIAQEPFFYRVSADGVELLRYGRDGVETDFPYEDYPTFFPGAGVALQAVSPEKQDALRRLNRSFEGDETEMEAIRKDLYEHHLELWDVRHQVGGEPFLIQGLALLECPDCGAAMPFLASVANDCLDSRGLAGDDGVQVLFHLCRRCNVVGVYQTTD